jgi:hypothetical protein
MSESRAACFRKINRSPLFALCLPPIRQWQTTSASALVAVLSPFLQLAGPDQPKRQTATSLLGASRFVRLFNNQRQNIASQNERPANENPDSTRAHCIYTPMLRMRPRRSGFIEPCLPSPAPKPPLGGQREGLPQRWRPAVSQARTAASGGTGNERASANIIDGPGQERPIAGRPAHDHWTNLPSSGRIQPIISPVMIALYRSIHRTQTAGLSALFSPASSRAQGPAICSGVIWCNIESRRAGEPPRAADKLNHMCART